MQHRSNVAKAQAAMQPAPRAFFLTALIVFTAFATAPMTIAFAAANDPPERTISVTASGDMSAEPDMVVVSAAVVTEADTAKSALNANSATMRKVLDGLKSGGIAARDIRTTQLSVDPRYTVGSSAKVPSLQGYGVTNRIQVTVREIARIGEVLDLVSGLGANKLGGIQFIVSKAETLTDEARKKAMENAIRRAELYAKASGAELGPVKSITEEIHGPVRPMGGVMRTAAASVPVEQGEQTLTVNVHVTWLLK